MTAWRRAARVLVLLLIAGGACTTWRRDPSVLSAPIPKRRPVQIWSGDHSLVAHGLRIEGDSLRAVPRWKAPECDTCARFFLVGAIDSLRVRRHSVVRTTVLVAGVLVLGYFLGQLAGVGGPGS